MTNNSRKKRRDQSQQDNILIKPAPPNAINPGDEPKGNISTYYSCTVDAKVNYIFTSEESKQKNRITTKRIAIASIIINATLAIFTWLLFNKASSQAKSAVDAVTLTQRSFDRNQKNYEIDNAPFLTIVKCDSFVFYTNNMPTFNYEITNLGKQTIKIKASYITLVYDDKETDTAFFNAAMKIKVIPSEYGSYISNGKSIIHNFPLVPSPMPEGATLFKEKKINLFFFARYTYTNYTNNKTRQYTCIIKIKNEGVGNKVKLIYRYLMNDNIDL